MAGAYLRFDAAPSWCKARTKDVDVYFCSEVDELTQNNYTLATELSIRDFIIESLSQRGVLEHHFGHAPHRTYSLS